MDMQQSRSLIEESYESILLTVQKGILLFTTFTEFKNINILYTLNNLK